MSWQNVENGQNTNRKDHSHATDKLVAIVQDRMSNMKENDFLDLLVLDILVFRSFGFRPSVLRPYVFRCSVFRRSIGHRNIICIAALFSHNSSIYHRNKSQGTKRQNGYVQSLDTVVNCTLCGVQ